MVVFISFCSVFNVVVQFRISVSTKSSSSRAFCNRLAKPCSRLEILPKTQILFSERQI